MKFGEVLQELAENCGKRFQNLIGTIVFKDEKGNLKYKDRYGELGTPLLTGSWFNKDWESIDEEDDSREFLLNMQNKSIAEQNFIKKEIIEAFRKFWKSNPSEKEFNKYMSGIVLFTEISYIMVKEK